MSTPNNCKTSAIDTSARSWRKSIPGMAFPPHSNREEEPVFYSLASPRSLDRQCADSHKLKMCVFPGNNRFEPSFIGKFYPLRDTNSPKNKGLQIAVMRTRKTQQSLRFPFASQSTSVLSNSAPPTDQFHH